MQRQQIKKNGSVEFNVTPNEGYTLGSNVVCDNNVIGTLENGKVTISKLTTYTLCTLDSSKKTYIVNVTGNNNSYGTVSPASSSVEYERDLTITITPKNGYKFLSNTCGGEVSENFMTVINITSDMICELYLVLIIVYMQY